MEYLICFYSIFTDIYANQDKKSPYFHTRININYNDFLFKNLDSATKAGMTKKKLKSYQARKKHARDKPRHIFIKKSQNFYFFEAAAVKCF